MKTLADWCASQWVLCDDEGDMRGKVDAFDDCFEAYAYDAQGNEHIVRDEARDRVVFSDRTEAMRAVAVYASKLIQAEQE